MTFQEDIQKAIKKLKLENIKLETPPNTNMGDLCFACFKLGGNPVEKAKEIASKLKPIGMIEKIEAIGPYVNFFINNEKITAQILKEASKKGYGKGKIKEKLLLEHTSINPNASPHVGRSRNALLGDSISRTLRFYGYDLETHYWVNDIGKQIAMLAYIVQRDKVKTFDFEEMLNLYVKVNAEMITNATVERGVFELLQKLEEGDSKTIKQFEKVSGLAFRGQKEILGKLGIKYDKVDYESEVLKDPKTLKDLLKKLKSKTYKADDGRLVLNLEGYNLPMKEPVLPLTRANGTSLYALRDIAYHVHKSKLCKNNITILGEDHRLEALQIKTILEKMLKIKAPKVIHYSFILLQGKEQGTEKMSTRKGNVVLLTHFMREARNKAREEIESRNKDADPEKLEKIGKIIGYGALKYAILKVSSEKNVIFNWKDALNFEGNSAPYIQYTYVRSKKILKNLDKITKPKKLILENEDEILLIKKIGQFPNIVKEMTQDYQVHKLSNYSYELANLFNTFYEKSQVTKERDNDKKMSRALLVKVYAETIKKSLYLLGIDVPEFM